MLLVSASLASTCFLIIRTETTINFSNSEYETISNMTRKPLSLGSDLDYVVFSQCLANVVIEFQ